MRWNRSWVEYKDSVASTTISSWTCVHAHKHTLSRAGCPANEVGHFHLWPATCPVAMGKHPLVTIVTQRQCMETLFTLPSYYSSDIYSDIYIHISDIYSAIQYPPTVFGQWSQHFSLSSFLQPFGFEFMRQLYGTSFYGGVFYYIIVWPFEKNTSHFFILLSWMISVYPSYLALYAYKPQKADELELRKGEMYRVTEKCQDGWFKGTSLRTAASGVFPGNYVTPVSRWDTHAHTFSLAFSEKYSLSFSFHTHHLSHPL